MTWDELQIEIALGVRTYTDLKYIDDVNLLSSLAKDILPLGETSLSDKWFCLCMIAKNKHTPLETLEYLYNEYEDRGGVLVREVEQSMKRWHSKTFS